MKLKQALTSTGGATLIRSDAAQASQAQVIAALLGTGAIKDGKAKTKRLLTFRERACKAIICAIESGELTPEETKYAESMVDRSKGVLRTKYMGTRVSIALYTNAVGQAKALMPKTTGSRTAKEKLIDDVIKAQREAYAKMTVAQLKAELKRLTAAPKKKAA